MADPNIIRPSFPKGYLANPKGFLTWKEVENKLIGAKHYWLCSVRPSQHPHVIPLWGAWVDDHFYFDGSPETRHARNISRNPFVEIHLESAEKPVIIEGTARSFIPPHDLAVKISQAYTFKYADLGYAPAPSSWDSGGLFEATPHTIIAWNSFTEDPTKFIFAVK